MNHPDMMVSTMSFPKLNSEMQFHGEKSKHQGLKSSWIWIGTLLSRFVGTAILHISLFYQEKLKTGSKKVLATSIYCHVIVSFVCFVVL